MERNAQTESTYHTVINPKDDRFIVDEVKRKMREFLERKDCLPTGKKMKVTIHVVMKIDDEDFEYPQIHEI